MKPDWETVRHLVDEFDLNDCEAADLSSWADSLTACVAGECDGEHRRLSEEDMKAHLTTRAEVLSWLGSPVQEMYDKLEKHIGRAMDYDELVG